MAKKRKTPYKLLTESYLLRSAHEREIEINLQKIHEEGEALTRLVERELAEDQAYIESMDLMEKNLLKKAQRVPSRRSKEGSRRGGQSTSSQ